MWSTKDRGKAQTLSSCPLVRLMASRMPPKLPPELFEGIICHIISTSDLYHLLLVSRFFYQETERFLYQNISIDEERYLATLSDSLSNLRLARLVRRLEVTSANHTVGDACLQSLHSTLRNLVSLEGFSIDGDLSFGANRKTYLLEHATTALKSIHFHDILWHTSLLEKQKQLRELIIRRHRSYWDLTCFPRLVILGSGGPFVTNYLTNYTSNVSRLQWRFGIPDSHQSPFIAIRSLDLLLSDNNPKVFVAIVKKFPNLEYLKCTYRTSVWKLMVSVLRHSNSQPVC